jgi:hypothetical protein
LRDSLLELKCCVNPLLLLLGKKKRKNLSRARAALVCVSSPCLHTATTSNSSLLPIWSFVFKKKLKEKRTRKSCVTCQSFTATDTCFSAASSCSTSYIFTLGNKTRTTHGTTHTHKKRGCSYNIDRWETVCRGGRSLAVYPLCHALIVYYGLSASVDTIPHCVWLLGLFGNSLYTTSRRIKSWETIFFPIDFFVFWVLFFLKENYFIFFVSNCYYFAAHHFDIVGDKWIEKRMSCPVGRTSPYQQFWYICLQ